MRGRRVRSSGLVQHAATEITAPDTDNLPAYWQFHEAVARAQLAAWLPSGRRVLVDVSGRRAPSAELAAQAGHSVVRVIAPGGRGGLGGKVSPQDRGVPGGRPPGPAQRRSAWWPAPRRGEATARSWPARWG